jgi:tetratricopeptide (TPR) repeat protein/DNA-binding CsgD family transcriptional regulator
MVISGSCNRPGDLESKHDKLFGNDTLLINTIIARLEADVYDNFDSAFHDLEIASSLSIEIDYQTGLANAYYHQGNLFYKQNKYQEALDFYTKAAELSDSLDYTLLKAKSLERRASVHLATDDPNHALKLYYESLPLFEKVKDKQGIAKVYNIIGLYKSAQKEYDTAVVYYTRAIRLNEEIDNKTGIIHNKGNLGYLYEKTGDFEQSKSLYFELVDSLTRWEDKQNLPVIYYNLSSMYQKLQLPDSAIKYLQSAMLISESTRDTSLLTELYGNYGEIMMGKKLYDSAYIFLDKSVQYARAIGDSRNEFGSFKELLHLDTLRGNYHTAASRFRMMLALKDSIHKKDLTHNLKNSELRYENQKKDNRIALQQHQIDTAEKQKQTFIYLFLFSLLSGALLLVIVLLILKNKQRRQRLHEKQMVIKDLKIKNDAISREIDQMRIHRIEEEMKVKQREQVSNALALEQKDELLTLINKKITDAMREDGILKIADLNGIVSNIKTQLLDSGEADLFNQKFSQLNEAFLSNLKQAHPDLTKSEIKFCAYLKLNLSGNQISKIQNVTTEAIRKTRYRVRKKMNLSPDESLEDYISNF